ncbi:MAG: hypothetical protein ACRYFE_04245 [Janthinobacterium lividum]
MPKIISGVLLDRGAATLISQNNNANEIALIDSLRAQSKLFVPFYDNDLYRKDKSLLRIFGNNLPPYADPCDKTEAAFTKSAMTNYRCTALDEYPHWIAGLAKAKSLAVITGIQVQNSILNPHLTCKAIGVQCWHVVDFFMPPPPQII